VHRILPVVLLAVPGHGTGQAGRGAGPCRRAQRDQQARRITNSGAFYAFIAADLGKTAGVAAAGVAAALVALLSYTLLQVGLYGALGPEPPRDRDSDSARLPCGGGR
jgi:hypothetical protein